MLGAGGTLTSEDVATPERRGIRSASTWINHLGVVCLAGYCLATSRWGAYLLPGPPYITDLFIMALLANRLLLHAAHRQEGNTAKGAREASVTILGGLLLVWTVLRLAAGDPGTEALRDAAPYLYCVVLFLVMPLSKDDDRTAIRVLMGLLLFHLAWVTVTVIVNQPDFFPEITWAPAPVGERSALYIFTLRPDLDSLSLGLLAAICLHRSLAGRRSTLNLAIFAWSMVVLFVGFNTTAGILAVLSQLIVVVLLGGLRRRELDRRENHPGMKRSAREAPLAVVAILLVLIPMGLFAARDTQVLVNLPVKLGLTQADSFSETRARGTVNARRNAWERVISEISSNPGQALMGVGFGPNYLVDTGANRLLTRQSGNESVRSPHNFWLGTWARTGYVGLTIMVMLFIVGLRIAYLVVRTGQANDVDVIAVMLVVSLTITATVGVVFESPFGAVPYFWALGRLAVRACQLGVATPFAMRTSRSQVSATGTPG